METKAWPAEINQWTPELYRQCRMQAGLTQAELAYMLGVTTETIHQRESGKTRIRPEAALAMNWIVAAPTHLMLVQDEMKRQGDQEGLQMMAREFDMQTAEEMPRRTRLQKLRRI